MLQLKYALLLQRGREAFQLSENPILMWYCSCLARLVYATNSLQMLLNTFLTVEACRSQFDVDQFKLITTQFYTPLNLVGKD